MTALPLHTASGLAAHGVEVHFAGVRAVAGADLVIQKGDIVGLIGPNGAGKTTLINAMTGFERVAAGQTYLDEVEITRWSPQRRAISGVSRTFQSTRLFASMTVSENILSAALCTSSKRREAAAMTARLLEEFGLTDRSNLAAGSLPYGDERRLSIARALATAPDYLCLDEPAAGLNEAESDQLAELLVKIRREFNCGLLIVEHDMRLIMGVCERIYVLDYGRVIACGTPAEVRADANVRTAYLGTHQDQRNAEY